MKRKYSRRLYFLLIHDIFLSSLNNHPYLIFDSLFDKRRFVCGKYLSYFCLCPFSKRAFRHRRVFCSIFPFYNVCESVFQTAGEEEGCPRMKRNLSLTKLLFLKQFLGFDHGRGSIRCITISPYLIGKCLIN